MKRRIKRRSDFDPVRDWDGRALITVHDMGAVDAEAYKRNYCCLVMEEHDVLPPKMRDLSREGVI